MNADARTDILRHMAASASMPTGRERRPAPIGDKHLVFDVLAGAIRNAFADRGKYRGHLLRQLWVELKRFGASNVQNIPLSRIRGIDDVRVDGSLAQHGALVVTALATLLECDTIFAFGAAGGDACAVLARNLPEARIYTLVPPEPQPLLGARSHPSPSLSHVTPLSGSAETFDLSRYSGKCDLVLIGAGSETSDLREVTDAAFSLLSELGTIVWDDYTNSAEAYAYLNAVAPTLDRPVFHILGTRLALYSRWDVVRPDD